MPPGNRRRDDRVCPTVFEIIDAALAEAKVYDIKEYADKFVAHAADDHSIATLTEDQRSLTLDKFDRIHVKGALHLAFTDFTADARASSFVYQRFTRRFHTFRNIGKPRG